MFKMPTEDYTPNPVVVKAFADLAAQMSEDNIVKGDAPAYMSTKEINRQIAALQHLAQQPLLQRSRHRNQL